MCIRRLLAAACLSALAAGCGGGGSSAPAQGGDGGSAGSGVRTATVASGLSHPWSLAFLPDGSMLVTERAGRLRRISADGATVSAPLTGLPAVVAAGQGGLLDVAVDPDFGTDPWIYWSYSEPGTGAEAGRAGTAVARGRLVGNAVQDVAVIFRQQPKVSGDGHFGARMAFAADGTLYVTLGERQTEDPASPGTRYAQNVATTLGKVVRITRTGAAAAGNPPYGGGALPGLFSIGHRNPQGAAIHPGTGELWLVEHGPQGGDEVNRVLPGRNYGWPLRSYGCPYGSIPGPACQVNGGTHAPGYEEPLATWVPISTAPSGMAFYTGDRFADWRGSLFVGALAGQVLWRLTLQGDTVVAREALLASLGERIRDVRQGPDGGIYLLTDADNGRVLRLER